MWRPAAAAAAAPQDAELAAGEFADAEFQLPEDDGDASTPTTSAVAV
jgi:hypothetical protein